MLAFGPAKTCPLSPLTQNPRLPKLPRWRIGSEMADNRELGLELPGPWAGGDKLISRLMNEALARPDLVSLAAGFVDQATLPVEAIQQALAALWSQPARGRPRCNTALRSATSRCARRLSPAWWRSTERPASDRRPPWTRSSSPPAATSSCTSWPIRSWIPATSCSVPPRVISSSWTPWPMSAHERWAWRSTPTASSPRPWNRNWAGGRRPGNWPA